MLKHQQSLPRMSRSYYVIPPRILWSCIVLNILLVVAALTHRYKTFHECTTYANSRSCVSPVVQTMSNLTSRCSTFENVLNHHDTEIHLGISLKGLMSLRQVIILLKSIVYFQGQYNEKLDGCPIHIPATIACCLYCQPTKMDIHLHLLIEKETKRRLEAIFNEEPIPSNIFIHYYDMEQHMHYVSNLRTPHHAGKPAMFKIFFPNILPETLDKVIIMDSDMLFNAEPIELWNEFDRFEEKQAIGFTIEAQQNEISGFANLSLPVSGVNGGLVLMDLRKLRKMNWSILIGNAISSTLKQHLMLLQAEQDIWNTFIGLRPELLHRIPCEWNVQMFSEDTQTHCPSVWPNYRPGTGSCLSEELQKYDLNLVKLAHQDTYPKPELVYLRSVLDEKGSKSMDKALTAAELRIRFAEMYRYLRGIPMKCFV